MLHKNMRFFLKEKQEPNIGDTRLIKKFLFFPKNLNNEIRWLETAIILQICELPPSLRLGGFVRSPSSPD